MMIGDPITNAQQLQQFKRINHLSDADVIQLSRYCKGEVDTWKRGKG